MSEKLEQVAKAIKTKAWELDLPLRNEECVDLARAAICAMRDPTEAMWNAPGRVDAFVNGVLPTGEEAERIYQAMIDEARK